MAQLADWSLPTSEVCGSNPAIDNFDRNNSSLKNAIDFIVPRFGENSQLWQKFTRHWKKIDSLFIIWQNAEPALAD